MVQQKSRVFNLLFYLTVYSWFPEILPILKVFAHYNVNQLSTFLELTDLDTKLLQWRSLVDHWLLTEDTAAHQVVLLEGTVAQQVVLLYTCIALVDQDTAVLELAVSLDKQSLQCQCELCLLVPVAVK